MSAKSPLPSRCAPAWPLAQMDLCHCDPRTACCERQLAGHAVSPRDLVFACVGPGRCAPVLPRSVHAPAHLLLQSAITARASPYTRLQNKHTSNRACLSPLCRPPAPLAASCVIAQPRFNPLRPLLRRLVGATVQSRLQDLLPPLSESLGSCLLVEARRMHASATLQPLPRP
ncbi:hypothetical protein B0J12DRAFT_213314 [Macrophomina phaseolina]|uniref:Uncharacterized protein n=1 Tax=Macrophomina phaseolina TaxID=35725 RepID=A0ABQ8G1F0_9PEZI|nr:hypothetical protein B0J12DRAFT_213314 [Macrophomina phaseolina]